MNCITPDKYINSVINGNDIDKLIDYLVQIPKQNIYDKLMKEEDTQFHIDWFSFYLRSVIADSNLFVDITANTRKCIKFFKDDIRKYEESLWNISNYKCDVHWLAQLKEKNRRIDQLEEELFCHKKPVENYKTKEEIYDLCFVFYICSLNQQIIERKQEIRFLKDIEKSMIEHAGRSEKVASSKGTEESMKDHARMSKMTKAQMDKDNENDKNDKAKNNNHELMDWNVYFSLAIKHIQTISSPVQYYINQLDILKKKKIKLICMMDILNVIKDTIDINKVHAELTKLITLADDYTNALQIKLFASHYNSPVNKNKKVISILTTQMYMFVDAISKYKDEYPHMILNEQNRQVTELEEQYAKLTKSSECTQDQIAVLSENLIKYQIRIEAVRDECERLMEKHENELKIAMGDTGTKTLHTVKKECPIEVENQQTGELNNEQKTSDETKAQYSKDDQTSAESQNGIFNPEKNLSPFEVKKNSIWELKCKNSQWKEKNHYIESKIKVYKDFLNNLMKNEGIDEEMASHTEKVAASDFELNQHFFSKVLFYYNLEQADCIQNAIQDRNKCYNLQLKEQCNVLYASV